MNMPGYAAEASLYRTNSHYAAARGGGFLSNGTTSVLPQGCGWLEGGICGTFIAASTAACIALCLDGGPIACAGCWTTALGPLFGLCKDCIPAWMRALIDEFESGGGGGGGGSGPPLCCPIGRSCRCGGKCVPGQGCVDGVCLRPNQECP